MQQPYTARWWAREIAMILMDLIGLVATVLAGVGSVLIVGMLAGAI